MLTTKSLPPFASFCAALILIFIAAGSPVVQAAATHTVCSSGCDFTTIQAAIDAASSGDTINVSSGTYSEAVTVNQSALKLIGEGSGSTTISGHTFTISASGTSAADNDRLVIQGVTITGATGHGIVLGSVSHVTLNDVYSTYNSSSGLSLSNVNDLIIQDSGFNHNTVAGLRLGTQEKLDGLTVTNSHFDNNVFGIVVFTVDSGTPDPSNDFTNVHISDTTFNNNTEKGLYFEKLSNATFDHITVDSSGTESTYNANAGIDINLKRKAYSDITIQDSIITNSGAVGSGAAPGGAAITIKARDDAPSYNSPAATLSNVTLTRLIIINNPVVGIRFGESAKNNATPTNVTVSYSRISGNPAGGLVNTTQASITASNNWWGCNEGPNTSGCDDISNTSTGSITQAPWLVLTAHPSSQTVEPGHIIDILADITTNSDGQASGGFVPDGSTINFASLSGSLTPPSAATTSGIATSAFTAGNSTGNTTVDVTLDNATVSVPIGIEQGGGGSSGESQTPVQSFSGDNVGSGTGGAITIEGAINKATNGTTTGNVYGNVLVQDGQFIANPATIGIPELLNMHILQAIDLYGLLPGGVSTFDFVSPLRVCLRGTGSVLFVDARTHTIQKLPAVSSGNYTCADVPAAGIILLVDDGASTPAALEAPATQSSSAPLSNCQVTMQYRVNLRSEPSSSSAIVTTLPFDLSVQATERDGDWYKVIYGDSQYYVSADLVSTQGDCGS